MKLLEKCCLLLIIVTCVMLWVTLLKWRLTNYVLFTTRLALQSCERSTVALPSSKRSTASLQSFKCLVRDVWLTNYKALKLVYLKPTKPRKNEWESACGCESVRERAREKAWESFFLIIRGSQKCWLLSSDSSPLSPSLSHSLSLTLSSFLSLSLPISKNNDLLQTLRGVGNGEKFSIKINQ